MTTVLVSSFTASAAEVHQFVADGDASMQRVYLAGTGSVRRRSAAHPAFARPDRQRRRGPLVPIHAGSCEAHVSVRAGRASFGKHAALHVNRISIGPVATGGVRMHQQPRLADGAGSHQHQAACNNMCAPTATRTAESCISIGHRRHWARC